MEKRNNISKKIGLAICYDTKNFGSQLQVLATVQKIEELGYNTEIIRYKKVLTPAFFLQTLPRLFNYDFVSAKLRFLQKKRTIRKYPELNKKIKIRNRRFDNFVDQYFTNLSIPYVGWENLVRNSSEKYDGFLCGSDQLWLPQNLGSHFYTLEFAPANKTKIAYATSFGVSRIPIYQRKSTANYLNRFQELSTREISGYHIIKELTGRNAEIVCDPTLLFHKDGWNSLIPEKKLFKEPYVFCYFLGTNNEHRKAALHFKEKTGLQLVTCPFLDNFIKEDLTFGDIQMFDMDAADFVNLIRHAEYILTDSFHGSVFSILHHKKFLVFNRFSAGTNSRNGRIDSLCSLLGLSERRYTGEVIQVLDDIEYKSVETRLEELRNASVTFLKRALERI